MTGQTIALKAADGHGFTGYSARPQGKARGTVIVIQEIFGVNSHIRAVADGFAADGYAAIAPALFDRYSRGVELGYGPDDIAKGRALKAEADTDLALADIRAAMDAADPKDGKIAVVGYCWGGFLTWMSACTLDGLSAAIGYYGGGIGTQKDRTPRCPTLLHFGVKDAMIPQDEVAAIQAAHPDLPISIWPADHGFNCDHRGSYHADSAAKARVETLDFITRNLG